MSNDLIPQHPGLSKAASQELQTRAQNIKERITASGPATKKIKTEGLNLKIGDTTGRLISLVVIDFIAKRTWYEEDYVTGQDYRPPTCWGLALNPDQMVPHPSVEEIGGEKQAESCAECPLNEWESSRRGGKGKDCMERRHMLVLPVGEEHVDDDFYELDIPSASLKSFDTFVDNVNEAWGIPPVGAIIDIELDETVRHVKHIFSNPQPNPQVEAHMARMDDAANILRNLKYTAADAEEDETSKRAPARKKAARKKAARTARRGR